MFETRIAEYVEDPFTHPAGGRPGRRVVQGIDCGEQTYILVGVATRKRTTRCFTPVSHPVGSTILSDEAGSRGPETTP